MTTVRKNLAGKLAAGVIKSRPGQHRGPRSESLDPQIMATPEAKAAIDELVAGGMNFYEAFRQVWRQLDPPKDDR